MSNSYRIRTTVGVDKSIRVKLDQDFESLEVLSIKVLQSDVYNRRCSDYGVIIGRVSVNNGFGVPNAKISVFVPLSDTDVTNNPIIANLYPYKNLTQLNGDGFLYNLLPSEQSYSNHVPTGSFFTRNEVLTNSTKVEIYNKYYKYNSVTNESGDYMILGIPLGSQTVVVNIDLSDIGEFSLSPQDMIRMGIATPQQVDGTKFKSSTNLNELPQIITINRNITVEPFWGDENVCEVGITRTDFDLSAEKNINIQPTSIFMGSVISTNEDQALKLKCKPALKSGSLCSLVTGPGQIQAIRQTIKTDINGRPALEVASLEEGGQVIDDNGTWMFDVPMNLDYVVTNEFGEQVLSNDPKKGIPTKGKYRFKVMWNQPTDLGARIKRANFLVPNIKEYGWGTSNGTDPLTGKNAGNRGNFGNLDNPCDYDSTISKTNNGRAAKASYAFSLDWNDYGEQNNNGAVTTLGQEMILEAINCQDRFYEMKYNKVYTVSQLITEYRRGDSNNRIIAIKNILDDTCESTNNKFPSNDAMFRIDIIYILFQVLMIIAYVILFIVIFIFHLYLWVLCKIILPIVSALKSFWCWLKDRGFSIVAISWYPFKNYAGGKCDDFTAKEQSIKDKCQDTVLPLPNITFPDCELCACDPAQPKPTPADPNAVVEEGNSPNADLVISGAYSKRPYNYGDSPGSFSQYKSADVNFITGLPTNGEIRDKGQSPTIINNDYDNNKILLQSTDLPWHERFNLFNVKAKYFNPSFDNPGGGVNQIGVRFDTDLNGGPLTVSNGNFNGKYHLDNVIAVLVDSNESSNFPIGGMLTTVDPTKTKDVNLLNVLPSNELGTNSITGTTIGTPYNGSKKINVTTVKVTYADPNQGLISNGQGVNLETVYTITGGSEQSYHKFAMDMEYLQVIENISVKDYVDAVTTLGSNLPDSFYERVINAKYSITATKGFTVTPSVLALNLPFDKLQRYENIWSNFIRPYIDKSDSLRVVFFVRGIDPNSPKTTISYDLSKLYSQNTWGKKIVTLNKMRMNIPVQGGIRCVDHNNIVTNDTKDTYSKQYLFYETFMWKPALTSLAIGPEPDPTTCKYDADGNPYDCKPYTPPEKDPFYRPANYACFKPFSTTAHTYYSALDEGLAQYSYDNYGKGVQDSANSTGKGLRINFNNNVNLGGNQGNALGGYIDTQPDYNNSEVSPWYETWANTMVWLYPNAPGTTNNRGYYPNEIVEGGNFAVLNLRTQNPSTWFVSYVNGDCIQQCTLGGVPICCFANPTYYQRLVSGLREGYGWITDSWYISFTYNSLAIGNNKAIPQVNIDLSNGNGRMVMRSDRLPSSSVEEINEKIRQLSYTLMSNNNFTYFTIDDEGGVSQNGGSSSVSGVGNAGDSKAANAETGACADILGTFSCEGMIPLDCYYVNGSSNFTYYPREVSKPIPSSGPGDCWGNRVPASDGGVFGLVQPEEIFNSGCYQLCTVPFETLKLDYKLLTEWRARMVISFGACRNVFSHYFTNNWVNGTLYAFSFKNSRRFTSPTDPVATKRNKPYNCFCKNTIYFNTDSNNFYYRSSPYNSTDKSFIGRQNGVNWFTNRTFGGNRKNLMFPTTITDLGPRDVYTQEIVFSNDYDGYIMKNLDTSTFKDVSDLLNTFIISRLINKSTLDKILSVIGVGQILTYFSRENLKIDGDYAQMNSINSELGTVGFSDESYNSCTDVFYNGANSKDAVIGIYFSSNTQVRDYVTPKRTIITDESTLNNADCAFEYFNVKTQVVPYYQWYVKKNFNPNSDNEDPNPSVLFGPYKPDSIFGSQLNDWSTEPYSATTFFSYGYQNLDRLLRSSRYFRTKGSTITKYYRSNIYSVDSSTPPVQNADTLYWDKNNPGDGNPHTERVINTGAPFYFYFGLIQGKSAFDRFTRKWIDTDIITD
jgi:uncharacterized protein YlzI (FlbEa/FlbD family)